MYIYIYIYIYMYIAIFHYYIMKHANIIDTAILLLVPPLTQTYYTDILTSNTNIPSLIHGNVCMSNTRPIPCFKLFYIFFINKYFLLLSNILYFPLRIKM